MIQIIPAVCNGMRLVSVLADQDAVEIGALYRKGKGSMIDSVRYFIDAGRRLKAKQDSLNHGEWLPWLEANADALGFDTRQTAARLMRTAAKWNVDATFDEQAAVAISREIWGNHNLRAISGTGEFEWYTPPEHIELARTVLGEIDLDPASSDRAQATVKARKYFTLEDDGLAQDWHGRVWLNPPYAYPTIADFVHKLVTEFEDGGVESAILLTHNNSDTAWFHESIGAVSAICFTRGRIHFINSGDEKAATIQGQTFHYFGSDVKKFRAVFGKIGAVLRP